VEVSLPILKVLITQISTFFNVIRRLNRDYWSGANDLNTLNTPEMVRITELLPTFIEVVDTSCDVLIASGESTVAVQSLFVWIEHQMHQKVVQPGFGFPQNRLLQTL
jgi:hypothetical protein